MFGFFKPKLSREEVFEKMIERLKVEGPGAFPFNMASAYTCFIGVFADVTGRDRRRSAENYTAFAKAIGESPRRAHNDHLSEIYKLCFTWDYNAYSDKKKAIRMLEIFRDQRIAGWDKHQTEEAA